MSTRRLNPKARAHLLALTAPATVRVRWTCSLYVGEPVWHGTSHYEPDECNSEFETDVDAAEYDAGCVSVRCPECGGELDQHADTNEVVDAAA